MNNSQEVQIPLCKDSSYLSMLPFKLKVVLIFCNQGGF